jgi:hypothetical protein
VVWSRAARSASSAAAISSAPRSAAIVPTGFENGV